jgi:hypothetical protein
LLLYAPHAGVTVLHVHFTPYWAIVDGSGCVAPAGENTALAVRRGGEIKLAVRFALDRVRASSARCT